MAEQNLSQLTPIINDNDLKFIESNGKILFSTEEIGRQLGYRNPSKSVNMLYSRNQTELAGYTVGIKLMSTDGNIMESGISPKKACIFCPCWRIRPVRRFFAHSLPGFFGN